MPRTSLGLILLSLVWDGDILHLFADVALVTQNIHIICGLRHDAGSQGAEIFTDMLCILVIGQESHIIELEQKSMKEMQHRVFQQKG